MIKLFRLLPQWVNGKYNYNEIEREEYDLMRQLKGEFTYFKSGKAPKLSPYASNVVFSFNKLSSHICRPFLGVQSGYIVSSMLRDVLLQLELAPCVFFPIQVKVKSVLQTWYFFYFYTSLRHNIDLRKSSFQWVDPNQSTYDPISGKVNESVIEENIDIDEDDLNTMGNIGGNKTLRSIRVVLRSELQIFDVFELDMVPNFLYVNEKAKEIFESQLKGLEIIDSSAYIE